VSKSLKPAYLSSTAIAVLKLMVSDLTKDYTIRRLAQGIHQDYRITYDTVKKLTENGVLNLERRANLHMCRPRVNKNVQVLAFIESLRTKKFLETRPSIRMILSTVVSRITKVSPFFCLTLFGSVAKGKAVSRSDVDMLLILPDLMFQNRVENELSSAARTSTIGVHEIILSADQFVSMLSEREMPKKPNVATEVLENHVVVYGAEAFYTLLSRVMA